MSQKTSLNATHRQLDAKMVDFGGWDMPLNYGSQIEEHHAVRRSAGMFDVSHMTVVDLHGEKTRAFLSRLLANDVAKLDVPGKALYTCMLTETGGIIDDLIVYFLGEGFFRVIVNAATHDRDMAWITRHAADFDVEVRERTDLAMIAVQGPQARDKVLDLLADVDHERIAGLGKFRGAAAQALHGVPLFVARTGYTGEDGFEILIDNEHVAALWQTLHDAGVVPAGLGARDTLRLEAGLNLYGQDMDDSVTPFEAALGWTVAMKDDREFIGRKALEEQEAAGVPTRLIGIVLEGKGILRHGQRISTDAGEGQVLSGSFAPTLEKAIGLARVPRDAGNESLQVEIRRKNLPLRHVKPPFVRAGKPADGV